MKKLTTTANAKELKMNINKIANELNNDIFLYKYTCLFNC